MNAQSTFDFCPTTVGKGAKEPKCADFKTPPCCDRQAIANFDHTIFHADHATEERVNRVCTRCFAHWYGPPNSVREYARSEWDALMESALEEDRIIAQPRYADYCAENGRTPAEQLAHDEVEYPGGKMAGFLAWSTRKSAKEAKRTEADREEWDRARIFHEGHA